MCGVRAINNKHFVFEFCLLSVQSVKAESYVLLRVVAGYYDRDLNRLRLHCSLTSISEFGGSEVSCHYYIGEYIWIDYLKEFSGRFKCMFCDGSAQLGLAQSSPLIKSIIHNSA